jgi:predicted AAA+ superfamily ATPase
LQIKPTDEDEIPAVLRRCLFERVDLFWAERLLAHSDKLTYLNNSDTNERAPTTFEEQLRGTYPLHPDTLRVLIEKTSSSNRLQSTRGILRILAHMIRQLWEGQPPDTFLIMPNHIDYTGEIARLAYRFWMDRADQDGPPESDWFRAEQEIGGK